MATVYFVRDGYGEDNRVVKYISLPSENIEKLFANFKTLYDPKEIPLLNGNSPVNPISNTRHVFLNIESIDICKKFPQIGFYLIDNLDPDVCVNLLSQQPYNYHV